MLKVLKNLKESAISVLVIVILLCVQAGTDLALPTYTSKIVNTGIQQGGIENASPELIAKDQMDNLLKFTNDDEKILIETDSPYLSPEPNRGKRNDCRNVKYIAKKIAEVKGKNIEEIAKITTENAKRIFKIND